MKSYFSFPGWLFHKYLLYCQSSKLFARSSMSTFVIKIGRKAGQGQWVQKEYQISGTIVHQHILQTFRGTGLLQLFSAQFPENSYWISCLLEVSFFQIFLWPGVFFPIPLTIQMISLLFQGKFLMDPLALSQLLYSNSSPPNHMSFSILFSTCLLTALFSSRKATGIIHFLHIPENSKKRKPCLGAAWPEAQ